MDYDFFKPQKLHPLGNVIAFVRNLVKFAKSFLLLLAYFLIKYKSVLYSPYLWFGILSLFLLLGIYSFLQYKNYRYVMDEQKAEVILTQGVFNKEKTVVKFSNILQVNVTQNLIQRILGIYSVSLDTSGSDKVEVDLYALDGKHANQLKQYLLSKIKNESPAASINENDLIEESKQSNLVFLEAKHILLVSLFTNYRQGLALFFAFCIAIFQNIKDAFDTFELDEEYNSYTTDFLSFDMAITSILLAIAFIVLIPFIINLFRYFLKYYDFTIFKNTKGTFSMQYGLTNKVNTIFNKDRVQLTEFKQNQILKRLGLGILSLKQIVLDPTKEEQSSIDIPGISISQKEVVYDLTYEDNVFEEMQFLRPKKNLFIARTVKVCIVFMLLIPLLKISVYDYSYSYFVLGIAFVLITLYNYLFYKSYSLGWNGKYLVKRVGVWNEKETIIPVRTIQSLAISQTFFQKRSYTSDLVVSTSAKVVTFNFFDRRALSKITNYSLYQLEK